MSLRRPGIVSLRVADLARSLRFWSEGLGIPVKLRTEGFAELQTETFTLELHEDPARPPATIGWEVEDLDASLAALAAAGLSAVERIPDGPAAVGRRARLVDPDGHVLEMTSHGAHPRVDRGGAPGAGG